MAKRVQAHVSGRVQGVGFRYYAAHVAQELGVVGTVRNTSEGGVEAIAEGEAPTLENFVAALQRGPHTAEVAEVTTAWSDATGEFSRFTTVS